MKSEIPTGDRFKHDGTIYRFWSDIEKWSEIRNNFTTIAKSYENVTLEEAANITIKNITGSE